MSKKQKAGLDWKTTALHVHYTILYISLPSLHDVDVKCLISRFVEDMNTGQLFSFSGLNSTSREYRLLESTPGNFFQHLTNWTRRNKRDKVWNSVNSLLKWRFPSWHRRCCLSSLSISVFVPSHAMVGLRWCYTTSSPGSTRDDS